MLTGPIPSNGIAAILLAVLTLAGGIGAAAAEEWCYPHCDYAHYYGPYDFSYARPGLFGYPQRCGPHGDCAPHLAYTTGILRRIPGRVTVRFPRFTPPQR